MTEPKPTSPPSETPVSPVSRTATFPDKQPSSAAAAHAPPIDTSVPAINAQPVELDGLPTSPQEQETKRREMGGSRVLSPADEDVEAEFLGEGGKGAGQLGREVGSPGIPSFVFVFSRERDVDAGAEACGDARESVEGPRCYCRYSERAYCGSG